MFRTYHQPTKNYNISMHALYKNHNKITHQQVSYMPNINGALTTDKPQRGNGYRTILILLDLYKLLDSWNRLRVS